MKFFITLLLASSIVTIALLFMIVGWFLSGKRKKLEKRCGPSTAIGRDSDQSNGKGECPKEGCELCSSKKKSP